MLNSKLLAQLVDTDAIVILSSSNWFKELRSNRYHYATRFARSFPVLFVQPDLHYKGYQFEDTQFEAIKVLHVWKRYDNKQIELLNAALLEAEVYKPVFWIYNGQFNHFLANSKSNSVLNVYHATEDYFSSDSYITTPAHQIQSLNNLLAQCQLLVCVSEGVAESYRQHSAFTGKSITINNGCDYKFYAPEPMNLILDNDTQGIPRKLGMTCEQLHTNNAKFIAFYQGNIFDKLDYELLIELATRLSSWQFQFCGRVLYNEKGWKQLANLPNVQYLGVLTPEQVRETSYRATVGLIPFVESEFLIERSFPLKAFEYLACGLPVVSIPIKALLPFKAVMQLASGVDEFELAIIQASELRYDKTHLTLRLQAARAQDYDDKVETVLATIRELSERPANLER